MFSTEIELRSAQLCNCSYKGITVPVAVSVYCVKDRFQLLAESQQFLHSSELGYVAQLSNPDRSVEFTAGRFAAKSALKILNPGMSFKNINVARGCFNQPVVQCESSFEVLISHDFEVPVSNKFEVSISHKKNIAVAIAFPATHPMAIDIETLNDLNYKVVESQMNPSEIDALKKMKVSYVSGLFQIWCIKEALSKVLKTGLTTSFDLFETYDHHLENNQLNCQFTNFYQYQAVSWKLKNTVVAVVFPKNVKLDINEKEIFHELYC
jgi:4'-phosphopantetheinyl transferase